MNTNKLKGLWEYGEDNDGWYVASSNNQRCYALSESDARSIVACANACAGIDTDALEKAGNVLQSCFDDLTDSCAELQTQRDELLAALIYHQAQTRPVIGTIDVIAKYEAIAKAVQP